MLKLSHFSLIAISGLIWLIIGCILLPLGLNFVVESAIVDSSSHPVLNFFTTFTGAKDQSALLLIACGLAVGFMKGRYVFGKSVQRNVNRILAMPNPASLFNLYSFPYLILLCSMFLLGYLVKFLPLDVRGGVDIVIGSALINGSVLFFRQAWASKTNKKTTMHTVE